MAPLHMTEPEWALRMWPVLVEAARDGRTVQYEDLKARIGYGGQTNWQGRILGRIARYCHDHNLPHLNVVAINQSGAPGDGIPYIADHLAERQRVFAFPWHEQRPVQAGDFQQTA